MNEVTRLEYLIFVFTAAVGALQLVAVRSKLNGLLFLKKPVLAHALSFLIIGFSFYWFFQRDNRMDTVMRRTGLEGSGMFFNFCLATFVALVFTFVASSLISMIHHKTTTSDNAAANGLEALKEQSYFEAIKHSFKSKEHQGNTK